MSADSTSHMWNIHVQTSRHFLYMLPVSVAASSSHGNAIRYIRPVLWMTSCFHMKRMGQNKRRRVCFIQFVRCRHLPSPTASPDCFTDFRPHRFFWANRFLVLVLPNFFVPVPCARLSWRYRQLLNVRKYIVSYRIVLYLVRCCTMRTCSHQY